MRSVAIGVIVLLLVGLQPFKNMAWAETMIGVAATIRGDVQVERGASDISVPLSSGDRIYVGDRIITGDDETVQFLLLDETILTLAGNGSLSIEEAQHELSECGPTLNATVRLSGMFRYLSPSSRNTYPPFIIGEEYTDRRHFEIVRDSENFTRLHLVSVCLSRLPEEFTRIQCPRWCPRGEVGPHCRVIGPSVAFESSDRVFADILCSGVTLLETDFEQDGFE